MKSPRRLPLKILPEQAYLRPETVARFLDISLAHTYALIAEGSIPSRKFGRAVRIPRSEFLATCGGHEKKLSSLSS
jgi:excisionase family DNA binding protein